MFDRDVLRSYLRDRWEFPDLEVTAFEEVPGGKSKLTVFATVTGAGPEPTRVVVRKDREASPLSSRAGDEHGVIAAVHAYGGIPCARPLLGETDPDVLGGTALISERVEGRRAGEFFPDLGKPGAHGRELMTHFATVLARLHTMPLTLLADTVVDTTPRPLTSERLDEEIAALAADLEKTRGPDFVSIPIALDWLSRHLAFVPADTPVGLNHGDIGLHNMLIRDGEVAALVDWELPRIAPAALELATVYNAVTSLTDWGAFTAAYLGAGGAPLAVDSRTIAFYRVQKALWLLWYARAASHLYWTGARRDIISAGVAFDSQFRHARNLAQALHDAMAVAWP